MDNKKDTDNTKKYNELVKLAIETFSDKTKAETYVIANELWGQVKKGTKTYDTAMNELKVKNRKRKSKSESYWVQMKSKKGQSKIGFPTTSKQPRSSTNQTNDSSSEQPSSSTNQTQDGPTVEAPPAQVIVDDEEDQAMKGIYL